MIPLVKRSLRLVPMLVCLGTLICGASAFAELAPTSPVSVVLQLERPSDGTAKVVIKNVSEETVLLNRKSLATPYLRGYFVSSGWLPEQQKGKGVTNEGVVLMREPSFFGLEPESRLGLLWEFLPENIVELRRGEEKVIEVSISEMAKADGLNLQSGYHGQVAVLFKDLVVGFKESGPDVFLFEKTYTSNKVEWDSKSQNERVEEP